jgi:hypothetical protein
MSIWILLGFILVKFCFEFILVKNIGIRMNFNESEWIPMNSNESEWIPMNPNEFQWIPIYAFGLGLLLGLGLYFTHMYLCDWQNFVIRIDEAFGIKFLVIYKFSPYSNYLNLMKKQKTRKNYILPKIRFSQNQLFCSVLPFEKFVTY